MVDYKIIKYKEQGQQRLCITFMLQAGEEFLQSQQADFAGAFVGDGFHLQGDGILFNGRGNDQGVNKDDYILQNEGDGVIILDLSKLFREQAESIELEGHYEAVTAVTIDFPIQEDKSTDKRDFYMQVFYEDEPIIVQQSSLKDVPSYKP